MSDSSKARATAASRLGLPLREYNARLAAGEKWCTGCKAWHRRAEFAADRSRTDGLTACCRSFRNSKARADYTPKERPKPGRRYVAARDGDEKQARGRVNYLVNQGLLPNPNDLPCADCGHVSRGQNRHEYDHHLGYAAEHHEDVEPVCSPCHHARTNSRRRTA